MISILLMLLYKEARKKSELAGELNILRCHASQLTRPVVHAAADDEDDVYHDAAGEVTG